jgi:hypothetical protein
MNPTGSTEAANTLTLEACTYSSWTNECGVSYGNPSMSAGSHGTVDLDLTAWEDDTGYGYAYVYGVEESGGVADYLVGLYIEN